MEQLTCRTEQSSSTRIDWRREKIQELTSKGHSQREISSIMHIGLGTVNRDMSYLREKAKENIGKFIHEKLPEEYEKCLVGLTAILKEAWNTAQNSEDKREKILALSLAKDCYSMKLELLTNATVVDDAIKFVSNHWDKKIKKDDSNTNLEDQIQHSFGINDEPIKTHNNIF